LDRRDPSASDEDLAAAAATGDATALETLLFRHADRVHRICRRIVPDPGDALDATQEALLRVATRIGHFDGRSAFTTWLYRVATNAALDEARRRSRRPRPVPDPDLDRAGTPDPADAATRIDVQAALAEVPEVFRVALVLRDLCDLPYEEIATILEVPIGTVRSRIARGRALLADRLSPGNRDPSEHRPSTTR
jgi:RNA polymerase sigma-70 factor (ECF subfamily)